MILLGPCTVWALNFSAPFGLVYDQVQFGSSRSKSIFITIVSNTLTFSWCSNDITNVSLYEDSLITLFSGIITNVQ